MHRVAQRRGLVNFTVASAHPRLALSGRKMRGLGTVGLAPTVALQLGADRARRAPQPLRHGALGEPGEQSNLDLNAFRQTQNRVRHRFGLGGRIIKSNQRARSGTAEPVPDRALWAKSTPCLNTTRRRCCSIYRRVVQIRHSNSSLSAPSAYICPPTPLNFSTKAEIFSNTVCFFDLYCGLSGLILGSVALSAVPFSVAYSRFKDALM